MTLVDRLITVVQSIGADVKALQAQVSPDRYKSVSSLALPTWRAALANRMTAPAKVVILGDSITEGQGASTQARRYTDLVASRLRANYVGIKTGGAYLPAWNMNQGPDSPWKTAVATGSPTQLQTIGLGLKSLYFNAAGSVTFTFIGDSFDLRYSTFAAGGSCSVVVDGVTLDAALSLAAAGDNPQAKKHYTPAQTASRIHTVVVSWVSGNAIIHGIQTFDGDYAAGIQVLNAGRYGALSNNYVDAGDDGLAVGTSIAVMHNKILTDIAPDLVIIELGGNNWLNDTGALTPAALVADLTQLITQFNAYAKVPDIVLVTNYGLPQAQSTSTRTWAEYASALDKLAKSYTNVFRSDWSMSMGNPARTTLLSSDGRHPNDLGHQTIANIVVKQIAPLEMGSSEPQLIPGAAGDGVTDDTAALQAAFATVGGNWLLEAGKTYLHTGTAALVVSGTGCKITAYGATLLSNNARYGGLVFTGTGTECRGLRHVVSGATARGNGENFDDCPFAVNNAAGVVWEDLTSIGSRDSQFFISGATRMRARNLYGRDSFADGLHISNGSNGVAIDGVTIVNPGDDGVATVSYTTDTAIVQNVTVRNIVVINSAARGVTISGGTNVEYSDIEVHRSFGSGVYMAIESGTFPTRPVTGCRISGADLYDCHYADTLDTGVVGMFALASGIVMTDSVIQGVRAYDTRKSTYGDVIYAKVGTGTGGGGRFRSCALRDVDLFGNSSKNLAVDNTSTALVTVGNHTYFQLSGTGVTATAEGAIIYGTTNTTDSTSSSGTPGLKFERIRSGPSWTGIDGGTL